MSEPQSLLQRFYDASLIPSDTDDERLTHYQATATDLAKRFKENPRDAASASRVAIDMDCPATDPWFNAVEEAVKVHWKTFLVKNHDAPRQICRAILLEALSKASEENWTATLAIWNASSSLFPHLSQGSEQAIVREVLIALGDECESQASKEWSGQAELHENIPEFKLKLPSGGAIQIDQTALETGLYAASGPNAPNGLQLKNPNQYWSGQNQQWSWQFAPRAAQAIATVVNKALAEATPSIDALGKELGPALNKHGKALGKAVLETARQNVKFTSLLWWKQALYSPSLRRSYRDLSPVTAVVAISFDLGTISGAPVPLSVEYFLRETLLNVLPQNPELTLGDLKKEITALSAVGNCLPVPPTGPLHRMSVREFLSSTRQTTLPDNDIPACTGISAATKLLASEWAVWLFRERLSEILTQAKAEA